MCAFDSRLAARVALTPVIRFRRAASASAKPNQPRLVLEELSSVGLDKLGVID